MGANTSRESPSTRYENGSTPQIEEAKELTPCLKSPTTNSSLSYAKKVRKKNHPVKTGCYKTFSILLENLQPFSLQAV